MELRHLRYFVALAEELHFGRAAEKLYITQPSLSRQIGSLEDELGTLLLTRGSRRVELTEPGRLFLAEARTILGDVEHATQTARRGQLGEIGTLRLGFVTVAAFSTLPELLAGFRKEYPGVELDLHELSSNAQLKEIVAGTLDAGIVRQPFAIDETLASCRISEDAQIVAVNVAHPLAAKRVVTLQDLEGEPLITFSREGGAPTYDSIIAACARVGFSPRIVHEAQRVASMIGLVAAGVGLAILSPDVKHFAHDAVVYRDLHPRLVIETGLVWDPASIRTRPALAAFLRSLPPGYAKRAVLTPRKRPQWARSSRGSLISSKL